MSLRQSLDGVQAAWREAALSLAADEESFCRPSHKSCLKLDTEPQDGEDGVAQSPDNSLMGGGKGEKKGFRQPLKGSFWAPIGR